MNRLEKIEKYISIVFSLKEDFVRTRTSRIEYANAKKVMCSLLYHKEEMRLIDVAKYMGYRDHSTVIHNLKKFEAFCETEPEYRKIVDKIFDMYHTITKHENQDLQHTPIEEQHMVADSNAAND